MKIYLSCAEYSRQDAFQVCKQMIKTWIPHVCYLHIGEIRFLATNDRLE